MVGDNGAGKSTLVKCIAGVRSPSDGQIHLEGTQHEFASPADALAAGVETVYQDLALVEMFDLTDNLFLGRELVRAWRARAVRVPAQARDDDRGAARRSPRSRPGSPTWMRRSTRCPVGSARWSRSARLPSGAAASLLLDEPTAALGVQESAGVLEMVQHTAARGDMAILVIAHNLEHIFSMLHARPRPAPRLAGRPT